MLFLPVEFDDCAGNEHVTFDVSDPNFRVDEDLSLVPLRDVPHGGPVLFIHGRSAKADDLAQVDIAGTPAQSAETLRVSRIRCMCASIFYVCFFPYR